MYYSNYAGQKRKPISSIHIWKEKGPYSSTFFHPFSKSCKKFYLWRQITLKLLHKILKKKKYVHFFTFTTNVQRMLNKKKLFPYSLLYEFWAVNFYFQDRNFVNLTEILFPTVRKWILGVLFPYARGERKQIFRCLGSGNEF